VIILALDGYFFDKDNNKIDHFPINDRLHGAIFDQGDKRFNIYQYICKLNDYYKDSVFIGDEVQRLAQDFESYKSLLQITITPKLIL
jgi:hypothetical protein